MRFVHARVRTQSRVDHDTVDEVVYDRGDAYTHHPAAHKE